MTTDARTRLLATLTACAEHGRPCPSLTQLAQSMRVNTSTVSTMLGDLKRAGKITWRLKNAPLYGQVRVVTIASTGKSTGEPGPVKPKTAPPPYTPTPNALTSAGRRLVGAEFKRRAAELLARDAAERARRAS